MPAPEIVTTRVLLFPRGQVFAAFLDPAQLAHWWGPNGFTNTIHEFDPRPGGVWRFVMHAPDGADYPNECAFVEVTEPERVVFDHVEPVHQFRLTMTFADEDGGTRLTWRMVFADPAEYARVKDFVVPANEQNFDRLATWLATGG